MGKHIEDVVKDMVTTLFVHLVTTMLDIEVVSVSIIVDNTLFYLVTLEIFNSAHLIVIGLH